MSSKMKIAPLFIAIIVMLLSTTSHASIVRYQYDILHRLSKVTRGDGSITVYGYDNLGNRTSKTVTSPFLAGDINGNNQVDITDLILSLQVATDTNPSQNTYPASDVNSDGKIGIEETIYVLRRVSDLEH